MQALQLPQREGQAPRSGAQPPQLQFSDTSPRDVHAKFAAWFFSTFEATREEPTRISVATTRALWLDESVPASQAAFMPPWGGREFAHLHDDGSLHVVLDPRDQLEVIRKGWGLEHPWKRRGVNEILVYAPRTVEEIEIIKPIVLASYTQATRQWQESKSGRLA